MPTATSPTAACCEWRVACILLVRPSQMSHDVFAVHQHTAKPSFATASTKDTANIHVFCPNLSMSMSGSRQLLLIIVRNILRCCCALNLLLQGLVKGLLFSTADMCGSTCSNSLGLRSNSMGLASGACFLGDSLIFCSRFSSSRADLYSFFRRRC